jgi:hypothetical protein
MAVNIFKSSIKIAEEFQRRLDRDLETDVKYNFI